MTATNVRTLPANSERDRCFFCATDEEITTAMSGIRGAFARVFGREPTIRWQGVSCPFEDA